MWSNFSTTSDGMAGWQGTGSCHIFANWIIPLLIPVRRSSWRTYAPNSRNWPNASRCFVLSIFWKSLLQVTPAIFIISCHTWSSERRKRGRSLSLTRDCRLMFSIWVKREPSPVADASNSSFYIILRSARASSPGFRVVFLPPSRSSLLRTSFGNRLSSQTMLLP